MARFAQVESLTKTLTPPWPRADLCHIAVAGRSNVGKSSLVNRLLGRRRLAKTGKTPGKTRGIEFFLVDGDFIVADLPGYGYARVGKELRRLWSAAVESYLQSEARPRGVLTLIDGRHPPTEQDVQLAAALTQLGIPWLPVLTKADKVLRGARRAAAETAAAALGCDAEDLIWTSAKSGEGIADTRGACLRLVRLAAAGDP